MQTLSVALGARSYSIHVGAGLLGRAGAFMPISGAQRVVIVTNPVVAAIHLRALEQGLAEARIACETIVIPDGEAHKTSSTLADIHTRLLELGAERSTPLLALGGGVVGDVAGFAAATYQRGMPLVQIPTTLLAQVDSSVGGKTAVNHPLGKNMIGAFHQPSVVLIDTATLTTLPEREYASGVAEIIKYGAALDRAFFEWLEQNIDALRRRDAAAIAYAIGRSCEIKAAVVAGDERESGDRALLNFGHTFGHAIETATGYGTWLHGEAVAAGMVLAAKLSQRITGLSAVDVERLQRLIQAAGLPVLPPAIDLDQWLRLMARDKKTSGGTMRFVLIDRIGSSAVRSGVSESDLRSVLGSGT
jgi:3-dehydroquinate synthase